MILRNLSLAVVCILAVVFFAASPAVAGGKVTPTSLAGVKYVSAEEVKAMLGKSNVVIMDMRKAINYGKGHVPGAVSNPYKWNQPKPKDPAQRTGMFDTSKLPADKNTTLIFHSDGPTGWKSYYAAKWAAENGYKKVLYMREGSAGWIAKKFPME